MRKIASLLAAASATMMLAAGASAVSPSSAEAAACKWYMPNSARIVQSNNHVVYLTYHRTSGSWTAKAYNNGKAITNSTEVSFTPSAPNVVRFVITWLNDSAGIYTGTIDRDGFLTGKTRDRFAPSQKASWFMANRAHCR